MAVHTTISKIHLRIVQSSTTAAASRQCIGCCAMTSMQQETSHLLLLTACCRCALTRSLRAVACSKMMSCMTCGMKAAADGGSRVECCCRRNCMQQQQLVAECVSIRMLVAVHLQGLCLSTASLLPCFKHQGFQLCGRQGSFKVRCVQRVSCCDVA